MTFRHMHNEIQSERLLLVTLEGQDSYSRDYRHIRAEVVRRAVPHVVKPANPQSPDDIGGVTTWNDEYAAKCSGYRNASWILSKTSGTYVDGMKLRGQIDVGTRPMNKGAPYGNKVEFTAHSIDWNTARSIADFYKKQDAFVEKHGLTRRDDSFFLQLYHLAQFLKITKILFRKEGVAHCSLAEADCFEECDIALASVRINEILAPFAVTEVNY